MNSYNIFKTKFKKSINNSAFILGNGINMYKDKDYIKKSWDTMMTDMWCNIMGKTKSSVPKGINYTEFYDICTFYRGLNDVRSFVKKFVEATYTPTDYTKKLVDKLMDLNIPVLTTNFDLCLEEGNTNKLKRHILKMSGKPSGFNYLYPICAYYSKRKLFSPLDGFGVWHINGTKDYVKSIRLGLCEYIGLSNYLRKAVLELDYARDTYRDAYENYWSKANTWVNILFHKNICICGLALDENEPVLRWLLIERQRYNLKYKLNLKGWYIMQGRKITEGKRLFLESVGFEIIHSNYEQIYEQLFDIKKVP